MRFSRLMVQPIRLDFFRFREFSSRCTAPDVCETGVGILELALILPVFLVIVLATLEFSHAYKSKQMAQTLSRAIGDLAYRQCAVETGIDAEACLYDIVLPRTLGQADALRTGVQVVVSVYSRGVGSPPRREAVACVERDITTCSARSHFSVATFTTPSVHQDLLNGHRLLIVAEVIYPHKPMFEFVPGVKLLRGGFYDASVI